MKPVAARMKGTNIYISEKKKNDEIELFNLIKTITREDRSGGKVNDLQSLQSLWESAKMMLRDNPNEESYKKYLDILSFGYAMRRHVYDRSILFLGINPSLVTEDGKKITESSNPIKEIKPTLLNSNHKYFKSIENLCIDLKNLGKGSNEFRYSHIDVFYLRCTKQNDLSEMMRNDKLKNFFVDQFKITKQIIFALNPIAIVVVNALAAKLLRPGITKDMFEQKPQVSKGYEILSEELKGLGQTWDKEKGTYVMDENTPLSGTPVFYSSMLSGQRALDVGSRQRLVWHINNVLNK